MNLFDELKWRGLVYDATDGLAEVFDQERVTAYIGFDPTASSLHIGNLLGLVTLSRLQRHGHSPIALAGGGTGMIGDPSGKSQERTLLTLDQINANLDGIRPQLVQFLDFDRPDNAARVVNNADWLATFDLLGFLRDTGKYFTVNYMLQKESVHRRLESEDGISYTEFSYLLLQSRDFLELFDRYGCTLQMGGSDQWGNITAGIELVRKVRAVKAHGLVTPLVTTASGAKFGKTEAGTIWLDPSRTRQSEFRNFWLNTDDRDVIAYLKYFTFLSRAEIDDLDARTRSEPGRREAQRVLAASVTTLVHGSEDASRAESANAALFGAKTSSGAVEDAAHTADRLLAIAGDVPSASMPASDFDGTGVSVVDVVAQVAAVSKSEARRLVQQGGVSVNEMKIADVNARLVRADALDGRVFLLRKGSRQRFVIRLT
jgi:tyrosyl-tRNA synthetase